MAIPNFVELERDILRQWKDEDVFKKTLGKKSPKGTFVFFEGPPTANGQPHMGHVETRVFKDIIPRFKTMQGYRVERKAGWDTQGLPVELEVEKAIGVSGKKDIEAYGIEQFNAQCRQSVWKYKELWEKMTERVGFWLDLEHPYITYQPEYIETLWWILRQAWDAKLLVQDYKVVPYCPRCGTALSSHEVAQGYERVKDRAVYVKFELVDEPRTYILAWTTTPWTLPGNVALAVDEKLTYVKALTSDGNVIVAKDLLSRLAADDQTGVVEEFKGKELVGKQYQPLFDFLDLRSHHPRPRSSARGGKREAAPPQAGGEVYKNAYTIVPADFVTTEEGTGVVHTAVMYGEDDFELGSKLDLPKKHTVDLEGKFNQLVKPWVGKEVKTKETDDAIVKYLKTHGKLYREEQYEHDYPYCWRCKHALLYYAKTSWFITMSKLRNELIKNNERINWVPTHIKDGRFGEWLREVKDWAISRERYWGTPLPIWICDHCKHQECIGSYEELLKKLPTRNRYIFVRHGEATISLKDKINTEITLNQHVVLTERGRQQVKKTAQALARQGVQVVVSSDFVRTKQTAQAIAAAAGVAMQTDSRLDEYQVGPEFEGQTTKEFHQRLGHVNRFHTLPPGGAETWLDVRKRLFELLFELDAKYDGQTIVLVSHGDPIFVAVWAASLKAESQVEAVHYPAFAEANEVRFPAVAFRPDGSFDPHRPFVDAVTWTCQTCGQGTMKRIPEVVDTWFDSGSMPLAQWHYPFENKGRFKNAYPADFISEAIDQTRGWFYTLLAISTFLQTTKAVPAGPPYNSCVVLGHIRDKQGRKLSKSLGNYIDPMKLLDTYGADAVRMYLFTINQPSEPKNFDEDQLAEVVKKNFMILWNVLSFWKLLGSSNELSVGSYQLSVDPSNRQPITDNAPVMDRWILALLDATSESVTKKLEHYAIVDAGRELMSFVTGLSTWYVRRSRERAKGDGRGEVTATLGYVLRQYAKLSAPFTPFLADALWRELGGKQSVHLEEWPSAGERHEELLATMARARQVVETGHALRAQAKLKVRQPLSQLVVTHEFRDTLIEVLKDELNVKEIVSAKKLPEGPDWMAAEDVALDITITDELREEGYLREMVRAINALRKELKLKPGKPVALAYQADAESAKVVEHFKAELMKKGGLSSLTTAASVGQPSTVAELDDRTVTFAKG
ncbi:MAG: class I tRNA ligase family protein [Candidatus Kerfeldbacteria bacterium]|nr:class I tRNA ligase family protein [Candidatus Kerfeldbacteria bacterium]